MTESSTPPLAVVPRSVLTDFLKWGLTHPKFVGLRKLTEDLDFTDPATLATEKIELNTYGYLLFRLNRPTDPEVRVHGNVVGEKRSEYQPDKLFEIYLGRTARIDNGTEEQPFVERFSLYEIKANLGGLSLSYAIRPTQHDNPAYKNPNPTLFMELMDEICAVEDFDWSEAEARAAMVRDDTR